MSAADRRFQALRIALSSTPMAEVDPLARLAEQVPFEHKPMFVKRLAAAPI